MPLVGRLLTQPPAALLIGIKCAYNYVNVTIRYLETVIISAPLVTLPSVAPLLPPTQQGVQTIYWSIQ